MILDFEGENPAKIVFNSEWLDKLTFKDVIELTSNVTVQQMIERDMFQERLKSNAPIYLHEFLYPVVTGYDSVALEVDLEIGGNDQMFNILVGRNLEKSLINKEKYALSTKLLVDKEGKKVGKTTGNALFVSSGPKDFYGGIMSFPDDTIELAFELLTEVDMNGLKEKIDMDPMNEKKRLAFEIVKLIWNENDATEAQKYFENTVQNKDSKNITVEVPVLKLNASTKDLKILVGPHVDSNSELKRLVTQNAIEVNNKVVKDLSFPLQGGELIKIGKKKLVRIEKN
jgi:tyrosyl-tRNA synthetase